MAPLESREFKESWVQKEIRDNLAPQVFQGHPVPLVHQVRHHTPQKKGESVVPYLEPVQGKSTSLRNHLRRKRMGHPKANTTGSFCQRSSAKSMDFAMTWAE